MDGWRCPSCGGDNVAGTRFCGHCGSPAPAGAEAAPPSAQTPAETARPIDEVDPSAGTTERRVDPLRSMVGEPVAERLLGPEGRLGEERRLVTALFADISGFTALAQRLDPEELQEVVDPLVGRLSAVAARHGAFVEKFAGDALLAVFGAPVAHEDDADRALLAALEMHQELELAREGLPAIARDLTLHVGVNSGHGVARLIGGAARMDYGVLGDAVILAQRLESAAPAGETYVGQTTLALVRGRFSVEPLGPLVLKGIAEPVLASRLLGQADADMAIGERPTMFVGREAEVATLETAILAFGTGGVVVVLGEAGAGKSSLVDAVRGTLPLGRVRWLTTRCLSYGSSLPFRPLAELVRTFAGARLDHSPEHAAELLGRASVADGVPEASPYLARLAGIPYRAVEEPSADEGDGSVIDPTEALEPEGFRRVLPDVIADWLTALGAGAPVALLVEDVHWIDDDSRSLLVEVAERLVGRPIGFVLTTRSDERAAADAIGDAAREGGAAVTPIDLVPIAADGVEALIREVLGGEPPRGLADAVAERSGGNPFFVVESVRALREGEQLILEDGAWRLAEDWDLASVPPTIEGILGGRIDRLPATTAWLLEQAAVIGRRVRGPILRAIAEPAGFERRLEELEAAGFVDRPPAGGADLVVFHHALVQEVAYARLLRRQRRELHLRVADAVEALYGTGGDDIDLLARHLWQARAGVRAVTALRQAATRARGLFANESALQGLRHAAEIAGETPEAASLIPALRLECAELEELMGDYGRAAQGYREVAEATGDLQAWIGAASVARKTGRYDEAFSILDAAAAQLDPDADKREIWLERAATLLFAGRFEAAADAARTGLALQGAGDGADPDDPAGDRVSGRLYMQLASAENRIPGRAREALAHALEARPLLEACEDLRGLVVVLRTVGLIHWGEGRLDEAAVALAEGLALAERIGGVEEIAGTLLNLGLVELALGRADDAVATDRRAVAEAGRVGHALVRMIATANLAEALVATDDLDEAEETARSALAMAAELEDPPIAADVDPDTRDGAAPRRPGQPRRSSWPRMRRRGSMRWVTAMPWPAAASSRPRPDRPWRTPNGPVPWRIGPVRSEPRVVLRAGRRIVRPAQSWRVSLACRCHRCWRGQAEAPRRAESPTFGA